jgi:DNA topoisomerase I
MYRRAPPRDHWTGGQSGERFLPTGPAMSERWILRKGTNRSGFRFVTPGGRPLADAATRARIKALSIPPAWTDVHVAPSARAAIQAWGFDSKGRKQYRYHETAVERGSLRKHYRVRQMALDLPLIREAVRRDFSATRRGRFSRERVTAGVVRLISEGFFRVGSERYAKENKTHGIATMAKRHVRVQGDAVHFNYVGKKSVEQWQVVVDRQLAHFVTEQLGTPGARLFRYRTDGGDWADLTARDVNHYLHELVGVPYTAKDFRTWGATLRAATVLAELGPGRTPSEARKNVVTAVRLVAAELGNTPAICRKSYIHPMVLARYEDEGVTIAADLPATTPPHRRRGAWRHAPEERALIRFLDRYFPERRKRRRRPAEERRAA